MKRRSEDDDGNATKRGKGEKGRSKGGKGKGGGGKSGSKISDRGLGHVKRHVFKVLCSDPLAANLIGKSGSARAQLEEETGSSVWISKREDLFPDPPFRLLILHADEPRNVFAAVEGVVPRIIEVGDRDRELGKVEGECPRGEESPLLGKVEGEYVFHAALPAMVRGKLIGTKGANIQELREKTGAKIFVENHAYNDHHWTRVIGTPNQMRHTLQLIHDIVQDVAHTDEFANWAISQPAAASFQTDRNRESRDRERDHEPRRHDRDRYEYPRNQDGARRRGGRGRDREERRGGREEDDEGRGGLQDPRFTPPADIPDAPPLEAIEAMSRQLPPGTLDVDHAVKCELPQDLIQDVMNQETQNFIQERSGTTIQLTETARDSGNVFMEVMFTGPLLSAYLAHFLLMQRVHERQAALDEEEAARAEETQGEQQSLEDLKAQVALLQSKLNEVQGDGQPSGGRGRRGGAGRR